MSRPAFIRFCDDLSELVRKNEPDRNCMLIHAIVFVVQFSLRNVLYDVGKGQFPTGQLNFRDTRLNARLNRRGN